MIDRRFGKQDYSRYQFIKVEKQDKVAVVTFNRPDSLNAFVLGMHGEMEDIMAQINLDEDVNAVVITGAGRGFCAGADVGGQDKKASSWTTADRVYSVRQQRGRRLINNMLEMRQPTIAAVNGAAAGLGATIALFCDIVVASEKARFGDTHIRIGLVPGDGGCAIWPLLVGMSKAKELLWTGEIINAPEALRLGLVSYMVPPEELMPKAMEIANRLAKGPATAIEYTKRALNKRLREDVNLVMDFSDAAQSLMYFTDDHKEGPRAFMEKREARFTGR